MPSLVSIASSEALSACHLSHLSLVLSNLILLDLVTHNICQGTPFSLWQKLKGNAQERIKCIGEKCIEIALCPVREGFTARAGPWSP